MTPKNMLQNIFPYSYMLVFFTHVQITAICVIVCVHVCLCMCACSSYMTTVNTFYSFTKANFYLCLASVHFGPRIEMKRFTQPLSVVMDDICLLKTHRAPYERHKMKHYIISGWHGNRGLNIVSLGKYWIWYPDRSRLENTEEYNFL